MPSENMFLLSGVRSGNACTVELTLHGPQKPHCRVQCPLQTSPGCGCSRLGAYRPCRRLPKLPLRNCDLYEQYASGRQINSGALSGYFFASTPASRLKHSSQIRISVTGPRVIGLRGIAGSCTNGVTDAQVSGSISTISMNSRFSILSTN